MFNGDLIEFNGDLAESNGNCLKVMELTVADGDFPESSRNRPRSA